MGKGNSLAIPIGNMTPTQIEQLKFALSEPRSSQWPLQPVLPGNWQDLTGELALNTVIAVSDWLEETQDVRCLGIEWSVDRVRSRPLLCYEDAVLVEMGGYAGFGRSGLINVIVHDDGMTVLNGTSARIHELNDELPPLLGETENRLEYLNLFMNWVHADNGRFQPVGSREDLERRLRPGSALPDSEIPVSGFSERHPPENSDVIAHFAGTVLYGNALFRAVMAVRPQGFVEMVEDEELLTDLPVREERLVGPMLVSQN